MDFQVLLMKAKSKWFAVKHSKTKKKVSKTNAHKLTTDRLWPLSLLVSVPAQFKFSMDEI